MNKTCRKKGHEWLRNIGGTEKVCARCGEWEDLRPRARTPYELYIAELMAQDASAELERMYEEAKGSMGGVAQLAGLGMALPCRYDRCPYCGR